MLVTELGITLSLQPAMSVFVSRSITQLFSLRYTLLLLSTVIEVREELYAKAWSPMLVTELGMVIEIRDLQPKKAYSPILVTESGIVTDVREEQPPKAEKPILVTEEGITLFLHPATSVFVLRSIMQLFSLKYTLLLLSTVIAAREEQPSKAESPILVTESGIVTDVREEQPPKAEKPILVTEEGMTTSFALPLYFFNTPFSICASRIKSSSR